MNIIMLGPPGIGKGTQGSILSSKLGVPKISGGDMLREEVRKATTLGHEIKSFMDHGRLVPDVVVMEIMQQRLKRSDCAKGFILDGFPRNIEQARALEKMASIDLVINLSASIEELAKRFSGRLTCRQCGGVYHVSYMPPKSEGLCDKCGGELYVREDQKKEVVETRIKVYEEQTKPLISHYKNKGMLTDIDAKGSVMEVAGKIETAVDDFRKVKKE